MIDGFKSAGGNAGQELYWVQRISRQLSSAEKRVSRLLIQKYSWKMIQSFEMLLKRTVRGLDLPSGLLIHMIPFKPNLSEHIYDYAVRLEACWNCHMACCGYHEQEEENIEHEGRGGNRQSGRFSALGVTDLEALNYLSDLLNDYGIDWKEAPGDIGVVMQLYNDGVISEQDTGGVNLRFGDCKVIAELIHLTAKRQKIGDRSADGKLTIARMIPEAKKYDNTVRGTTGYGKDDPERAVGVSGCGYVPLYPL